MSTALGSIGYQVLFIIHLDLSTQLPVPQMAVVAPQLLPELTVWPPPTRQEQDGGQDVAATGSELAFHPGVCIHYDKRRSTTNCPPQSDTAQRLMVAGVAVTNAQSQIAW